MEDPIRVETVVKSRYAEGALRRVADLCCPVDYDPRYLQMLPAEVIEKDYGCGDPSRYLRPGETVLDLGSGAGKICFIAAQVVGAEGRVIGVDMTSDMLDVARRNAPLVSAQLGYDNVEFRRGRIQDLGLDLDALGEALGKRPVHTVEDLFAVEELAAELRRTQPLIADESIDVVVSNCVLNLVAAPLKRRLFGEIHRVLKRGGRAVISDIVSDEEVPLRLQRDADLWSGCISGALTEEGFLHAFEEAGFYGIRILERQYDPWQVVEGIEFRSLTLEAFKGKEGPCLERHQAVVYRGPFKAVMDDDGHRLERGQRVAVCDKTFDIYRREPYREHFDFIEPRISVAVDEAAPFDCTRSSRRHPRESKGADYRVTQEATNGCGPEGCC